MRHNMKRRRYYVGLLLLPMFTGCGPGIQEALLLAADSGTRTLIDILLSDLVAGAPDYFSFPPGFVADDTDNGS